MSELEEDDIMLCQKAFEGLDEDLTGTIDYDKLE
jgi:hypothetical protein